jgi:hypothetical protein
VVLAATVPLELLAVEVLVAVLCVVPHELEPVLVDPWACPSLHFSAVGLQTTHWSPWQASPWSQAEAGRGVARGARAVVVRVAIAAARATREVGSAGVRVRVAAAQSTGSEGKHAGDESETAMRVHGVLRQGVGC